MIIKFSKWLALREAVGQIDLKGFAPSKDMEVPSVGHEDEFKSFGLPTDTTSRAPAPDLKDLVNVGTEDNPMGRIDQYINNLVDSWRSFTATADKPSPAGGGGFSYSW